MAPSSTEEPYAKGNTSMRQLLPAILLFAAATALPTLARADALDFVVTGAGRTFTFSLPESRYVVNLRYRSGFDAQANDGTINGIGPYQVGVSFYLGEVFQFGVPLGSYSDPNYFEATLFQIDGGSSPIKESAIYDPPYHDVFFDIVPGTYNSVTTPDNSPGGIPFTLTITPEAPTSVTPEPATLTLLATGALGLLTTRRRIS